MKYKVWFLMVVLLIGIALTGCAGKPEINPALDDEVPTETDISGVTPEVLTIAITQDENSLTPVTYVNAAPGYDTMRLLYDSLFAISPENTVIPWMVEDDYNMSDDLKVITMTLQDGQEWHDGTPLTGEDVAFTFDYFKNTFTHSRWTPIANQVESVVVNDKEVTITLLDPNPGFLRSGLAEIRIIAKHQYEGVDDPTDLPNMGSGAFKLMEYRLGQSYTLEAVDHYFRGTPKVKTIQMPIMDESAAQKALLAGGIAAYTGGVSVELIDMFNENSDIDLEMSDGYASNLLLFNNVRAPFDNSDFRKAISLAVNLDQLVDQIVLGFATKGTGGYIRDGLDEHVAGLEYTFDTDAANTLLDSIGYAAKDASGMRLDLEGNAMEFELLTTSNRSRIAELLQQQLAVVGLNIRVTVMDIDALDERVWPDFDLTKPHDYDMTMFGWSAPVVQRPGAILGAFSSGGGQNLSRYSNPEFDTLAEQYLLSSDLTERKSLNEQMQKIAAEDVPFITLYFPDVISAVNKNMYEDWVFVKGGSAVNVFSFLPE